MNDILFKIKRRINKPSLIKRDIRFLFQRLTRGWDDSETFSLDYSLARVILPRLKRFKKIKTAIPHGLTEEEWDNILDKMIEFFEIVSSDAYWDVSPSDLEKRKDGIKLFAEHYLSLWW